MRWSVGRMTRPAARARARTSARIFPALPCALRMPTSSSSLCGPSPKVRQQAVALRAHAARTKLYRILVAEHNFHTPRRGHRFPFGWRDSNAEVSAWSSNELGKGTGWSQLNNATFRSGSAQGEGKGREHAHFSDCVWGEAASSARPRFARGHGSADREDAAGAAH